MTPQPRRRRRVVRGRRPPAPHAALVLAVGATVAAVAGTAASAQAAVPPAALVSVVHGINIPAVAKADLYVNGVKVFDDLDYGASASLAAPPGQYQLSIADMASAAAADPVLSQALAVTGDVSVVAHVDRQGVPLVAAFADDLRPPPAGRARLVVRHAASAPALSVRSGGLELARTLTNGVEVAADVPAGTRSVEFLAAGTPVPGLGSPPVALAEGGVYAVYATGSATHGYRVVVDVLGADAPIPAYTGAVPSPADVPSAVPAGGGGTGWSAGPGGLAALAAAAAVLASWRAAAWGHRRRYGIVT